MVSPTTDRRFAISGNLGMKAPVRMGTTANITLSGLQTIDAVVGVADDRVLVKDQTDPIENGIWVQSTGAWTRDLDFNGTKDAITGTAVIIAEGSQAGGVWKVATTGTINPGTSSITFSVSFASDSANIKNTPAGSIAALTTQGAINELDGEKAALAGASFTGAISATTGTFSAAISAVGAAFTGLINQAKGADIASASTVDLTAATGNTLHITGTTPITAFTMNAGQLMEIIVDAACPLTYHATTMRLNTNGKNHTCSANDRLFVGYDGVTTFVSIVKDNGSTASSPFVSAEQTISAAGLLTIAHGLGSSPSLVQGRVICKTAELGYSIGDEVLVADHTQASATVNGFGLAMWLDATNVNVRFGSTGSPILIADKTTGALTSTTNANWKYVVRAWI